MRTPAVSDGAARYVFGPASPVSSPAIAVEPAALARPDGVLVLSPGQLDDRLPAVLAAHPRVEMCVTGALDDAMHSRWIEALGERWFSYAVSSWIA